MRVIDVYPYRQTGRGAAEFLVFHRAADTVYAGQWRIVGGKINPDEAAWQAASRELKEETGQSARLLWALPSINSFYEWQYDRINLIPAFAAAIENDPTLDHEHDDFRWLAAEEAAALLKWPEQQRLILLANQMLEAGIPPELCITPR